MTALALIISAVMTVLAIVHLLWAIGYWFPIRDQAALARAVIGKSDVSTMPSAVPSAFVSMALLFGTVLPHRPEFPLHAPLMWTYAGVLLARGTAAYLPAWRRLLPEEPFASLDRKYYGPLCLGLGIGYLILQTGAF